MAAADVLLAPATGGGGAGSSHRTPRSRPSATAAGQRGGLRQGAELANIEVPVVTSATMARPVTDR